MAANRAYVQYGYGSLGSGFDGTSYFPGFQVEYIVLNSDNVAIYGEGSRVATISFTYSDTKMEKLIIDAVQAEESDSSLQVYIIP